MSKETGLFEEIGNAVNPEAKKIVPKKKPATKAIAVTPKQEIAIQSETAALLKLAIDKNLDVDKLEKLIDLKNREDDKLCKKEFDLHFSEMKNELPLIEKTMEVTDDNGKHMYDFAPLPEMQALCDPIISKHKFSYYWGEVEIPEQKVKRVTFYLSGYGHTRENSFDVAEIPTNKWANAIQVGGIRSSYGNRYTMMGGLALVVKGTDNDAANLTFNDGIEYAEQIVWLKSCNSREDLLSVFKKIVETLKKNNDTIGKGVLTEVYTDMKKELK